MTGTPSQIEWAKQIKPQVGAEFDRVANALQAAARTQTELDQVDTQTVITILAEKRVEVLANEQAGYFIREWRELSDQVRQMIAQDNRYQTIQTSRAARRRFAVGQ